MNFFYAALIVDAIRTAATGAGPIAVPIAMALFGPSLAARRVAHAIRLLRSPIWQ